jgi:chlorite dismutase
MTAETPDTAAAPGTAQPQVFVQAVGLGLDPGWRRRPDEERTADGRALCEAEAATTESGVRTLTFSSIGLEPGVDLVLLRLAPSMELLEGAGARLARSGLGRWLTVRHSILARIVPTQYATKPTDQERSLLDGEPRRYLIAYPFTKSTDWYLLSQESRQGVMNEHMRVGHQYPTIRQALAYSFGLDAQDFVVAYETDDLVAFGDLVRALRATESRRSTVNDTPILLGIHRPVDEILGLLGAA